MKNFVNGIKKWGLIIYFNLTIQAFLLSYRYIFTHKLTDTPITIIMPMLTIH